MKHYAIFVVVIIAVLSGLYIPGQFVRHFYVENIEQIDIPQLSGIKTAHFSKCNVNTLAFFKQKNNINAISTASIQINLNSIYISNYVKSCNINGQEFREGQKVGLIKVLKIGKNSVLIKVRNKIERLKLDVFATAKD